MKKIILVTFAAIAGLAISSCNQNRLDIPQRGVYAEEDFYKTEQDCEQALNAIYAGIRTSIWYSLYKLTEYRGDDLYKGSSGYKTDDDHTFMLGIYDDSHDLVKSVWQNLYVIINRCNLVIDNFRGANSLVLQEAVAEALTIRSWCYLYLIQGWHNPPIIDHVLRTSAEFSQPNASTEVLWKFVIDSCDEAINSGVMYSKKSVDDKSFARATKEFAIAVKGKAQVLSGDYAGAKKTLEQIIDSGKYALIPSAQLKDLFWSTEGDFNCESIFEINIAMTEENCKKVYAGDHNSYSIPRIDRLSVRSGSYLKQYPDGNQYFQASYPFLKAILENEGSNSYRFRAWFWTYEDMQELGLNEMCALRSSSTQKLLDQYPADQANPNLDSSTKNDHCGEICGIWNRKTTPAPDEIFLENIEYTGINRRHMRYAEILLLYAEACAQLGETSGKGLEKLNEIATRAGAPTYSTLNMDNLKKEKWFEMWGEGTRFFDLVRWGDAATKLTDHWNTLPVFYGYKKGKSAKDINETGSNLFDVYEIRMFDVATFTKQKYGFKAGRDEYFPYPAKERANNPVLNQNPGW